MKKGKSIGLVIGLFVSIGCLIVWPSNVVASEKIDSIKLEYKYKVGEILKYKVNMDIWQNYAFIEGPKSFKNSDYEISLEELVKDCSGKVLKLEIDVTWKGYVAPTLKTGMKKIKVLAILDRKTKLVKLEKLIGDGGDFHSFKYFMKRLLPILHMPIELPCEVPIVDKIGMVSWFVEDSRNPYPWGVVINEPLSIPTTNSNYVKGPEVINGHNCAVIKSLSIGVADTAKFKQVAISSIYFDYDKGKIVRISSDISTEQNDLVGLYYVRIDAERIDE